MCSTGVYNKIIDRILSRYVRIKKGTKQYDSRTRKEREEYVKSM